MPGWLERSVELLEHDLIEPLDHTGLGVRDIAAATGFSDERRLIRRFREPTGLTPRAFRDAGS